MANSNNNANKTVRTSTNPETDITTKEVGGEDKKMVDKVNQQMAKETEEESTFAKVVGVGLILLGFFLVG